MQRMFVCGRKIRSGKGYDSVLDELHEQFRRFGGQMSSTSNGFSVHDGLNEVDGNWFTSMDATLTLREKDPGVFEAEVELRGNPNSLFWIVLVIGFCFTLVGFVVPLIAHFGLFNPVPAYQRALDRAAGNLE
jgi:hypothetical protein